MVQTQTVRHNNILLITSLPPTFNAKYIPTMNRVLVSTDDDTETYTSMHVLAAPVCIQGQTINTQLIQNNTHARRKTTVKIDMNNDFKMTGTDSN